jgi:hypothetical protein
MKSCFSYRFYRLTVVLALVFALGFIFPGSLAPQTDQERKWVERNYYKILNDLLPMRGNSGFYVTFRATETLHLSKSQDPEVYFLLGIDFSAKENTLNRFISAHLRTAGPKSIFDQVMSMHHENSSMDWQTIERKIKLNSLDFTQTDCPAIGSEFREFQNLKYAPPQTNVDELEVVLDPPVYEFHIQATYGQSDIQLYDGSHSLVAWAMKTQRELEACATEKNRPNDRH